MLEAVKEDATRAPRAISPIDQRAIAQALDRLLRAVRPRSRAAAAAAAVQRMRQLANLRWRADVLGSICVRDSDVDAGDPPPVSFAGQVRSR